mgnify:FL=1
MYNNNEPDKMQLLLDAQKFTAELRDEAEKAKLIADMAYKAEKDAAHDFISSHPFYLKVNAVVREAIADLRHENSERTHLKALERYMKDYITGVPVHIDKISQCGWSTDGWSINFSHNGHEYILEVPNCDRVRETYETMLRGMLYLGVRQGESYIECVEQSYNTDDFKKHFSAKD